jgi:hypothetical protein
VAPLDALAFTSALAASRAVTRGRSPFCDA